jgi:hypothetical protein
LESFKENVGLLPFAALEYKHQGEKGYFSFEEEQVER